MPAASGPPPLLVTCVFALWTGFFLLSPFLIFQSGLPQPADFLMAVAIVGFIGFYVFKGPYQLDPTLVIGGAFVALTLVINLLNYLAIPDARFLLHAKIYLFNFFVFLITAWLFQHNPHRMMQVIIGGLLGLTIMQIGVTTLTDTVQNARTLGTFNSPNQLAYWSMLSIMILMVLRYHDRWQPLDAIPLLGLFYLQTLALSKATLIVSFVLIVMIVAMTAMPRTARAILVTITGLMVLFFAVQPSTLGYLLEKASTIEQVIDRIESIGDEPDENLGARGYKRVFERPEFLLLGSGEGGYAQKYGLHKEIHSGLVTFLMAYGIVGFGLFLAFLVMIFNRLPWFYWALLAGILFYGLTHQNFRDSYFWVFLGIVYGQRHFLWPSQKFIKINENNALAT